MMLRAAKRRLSSSPVIRPWRDACVFARPTTGPTASPEGKQDYLNALEHVEGPGG